MKREAWIIAAAIIAAAIIIAFATQTRPAPPPPPKPYPAISVPAQVECIPNQEDYPGFYEGHWQNQVCVPNF